MGCLRKYRLNHEWRSHRKELQSFRSCETYGWVPEGKVLAGREVVQAGVGPVVVEVVQVALQRLLGGVEDRFDRDAAVELVTKRALRSFDVRILFRGSRMILVQDNAKREAGILENVLELRALINLNRSNRERAGLQQVAQKVERINRASLQAESREGCATSNVDGAEVPPRGDRFARVESIDLEQVARRFYRPG